MNTDDLGRTAVVVGFDKIPFISVDYFTDNRRFTHSNKRSISINELAIKTDLIQSILYTSCKKNVTSRESRLNKYYFFNRKIINHILFYYNDNIGTTTSAYMMANILFIICGFLEIGGGVVISVK